MSTPLPTENEDKKSQKTDAVKNGQSSHQNEYKPQARHNASRAGLFASQLDQKRAKALAQHGYRLRKREYIKGLRRRIQELEDEVYLLKMRAALNNGAPSDNNSGLDTLMGMALSIGPNAQRPIIDCNMTESLYTTGLEENSFYDEFPMGGQPVKYRWNVLSSV